MRPNSTDAKDGQVHLKQKKERQEKILNKEGGKTKKGAFFDDLPYGWGEKRRVQEREPAHSREEVTKGGGGAPARCCG